MKKNILYSIIATGLFIQHAHAVKFKNQSSEVAYVQRACNFAGAPFPGSTVLKPFTPIKKNKDLEDRDAVEIIVRATIMKCCCIKSKEIRQTFKDLKESTVVTLNKDLTFTRDDNEANV